MVIFLSSCDYSYHKNIGDFYVLRAVNSPVSMTIGYGDENGSEGLLPHTIYETHWNEKFIIAFRHPSDGVNQGSIKKEITEYYFINKQLGNRNLERVKGPYNLVQTDSILKVYQLDLHKMDSKIFDDLK